LLVAAFAYLSALVSGRTLGLRLLGGRAFCHLVGFARLRKRLRILPLTRAAVVLLGEMHEPVTPSEARNLREAEP
jgi:hypothetical protein